MDASHDSQNRQSPSIGELYDKLEELISQLPKDRQKLALGLLNQGTLAEDLKKAIADSGMTTYAIGKAAGVSPGLIDRFVSGERDMRVATASRICEALGYGLTKLEDRSTAPAKKKAVRKKKPPG